MILREHRTPTWFCSLMRFLSVRKEKQNNKKRVKYDMDFSTVYKRDGIGQFNIKNRNLNIMKMDVTMEILLKYMKKQV